MISKSLFIATPISAFSSNDEYIRFRSWITKLTQKISDDGIYDDVFCVACKVKSQELLDDPVDSLIGDIDKLDKSDCFLFIYPVETPTSALIELGYAFAKNMPIKIVHIKNIPLPFMATKMDKVYKNVEKIELDEFDLSSMDIILKALATPET